MNAAMPPVHAELRSRPIAAAASAFALYLLAALISLFIALDKPVSIPIWPAAALGCGISLGLIWRHGPMVVPALVIAGVLAHLLAGIALVPALAVGVVQPLAGLAAAATLRSLGFHSAMERSCDYLAFVMAGPVVVALSTSIVAALTDPVAVLGWPELPVTTLRGWVATMTGASLISPLLLVRAQPDSAADDHRISLLFALLAGVLIVGSQMRGLPAPFTLACSYALFSVALIGALYQRPRRVAETVLVTGVLGIVCAGLAWGPFAQSADDNQRMLLMFKLILLANGSLAISAVRNEARRLADRDHARLRSLLDADRRRSSENAATALAAELNQPLSAIRSYADAAARLMEASADGPIQAESLQRALRGIVQGTERASGLIRGQRAFQPGEALPSADLNAAIARALATLDWELQSRRIAVRAHTDAGLPSVIADNRELERIVLLALHIAIEFAEQARRSLQRHRLTITTGLLHEQAAARVTLRMDLGGSLLHVAGPGSDEATAYEVDLERMRAAGGTFAVNSGGRHHEIEITLPVVASEESS
ncbi:MAG: hypothetical protein RQ729_00325 [Wenzhouxiangellaceae bacterium]|nr:hypothetical protein [Wenzhouxiangellaceae bacterium]